MIEEVQRGGAVTNAALASLYLPAPRIRLKDETDAAPDDVLGLNQVGRIVKTQHSAVEVVSIPAQWTVRWYVHGARTVYRELALGRVVVDEDKLVKQRLEVEFLDAQIIAGSSPTAERGG